MNVDIRRISIQGTNFYKASQRCASQVKISDNKFEILLIPECVCLAFSIELNLKALIYSEGHVPEETHDIRKLFKTLNGKTQNIIESAVGYDNIKFDQKLKEIANSFKFWRYVYEQGDFSFDLEVLNKLAFACEAQSNSKIT